MDNLSPEIFEVYKDKWWKCKEKEWDRKNHKNIIIKSIEFEWRAMRIEALGNGSYGRIWGVTFSGPSQIFVKKIYNGRATAEDIAAEVRVLSLDGKGSEYIPKLLFSGYNMSLEWCLIMEWINGGTLKYHVFDIHSIIPFEAKRTILWQIARGLEFLHKNKLTHGDLKTDNIALTHNGHARLLDFNNSRLSEQKEKRKEKLKIEKKEKLPQGSMCFQAPEVFMGIKAGLASDLWSYGVVVTHLITEELIIRHSIPLIGPLLAKTIKTGNEAADKYVHDLMKIKPSNRHTKISTHVFFNDVSQIPLFKPGRAFSLDEEEDESIAAVGGKKSEELQKTSIRIPTVEYFKSQVKILGAEEDKNRRK